MRWLGFWAVVVAFAFAAFPASASAAVSGVFAGQTMNGEPIPCAAAQPDGVRVCTGDINGVGGADLRLKSFDGVPLALFVTLPATPASGVDGGYPLVVQSHGWGAPPSGPDDTQYGGPSAREWAKDGYAVVQFAARGWGNSCGSAESRLVNPSACAKGYLHLDDYRFEARDVQNAVGLLVDSGLADPDRIGVTGESYGAGVSLALATLKDRVMEADGSLVPWKSPRGTPLHIAAAAPYAGWSDIVYSLVPNGRTLDSQVTSATANFTPVGVAKQTVASGLYTVGTLGAFYSPVGQDASGDMTTWFTNTLAGEPYTTPSVAATVRQLTQFHSPYYMLAGAYGFEKRAPAPLFLSNGFTDDVFPADEALRYYNLTRTLYPSNPISVFFYDGGHQRGNNKAIDAAAVQLPARIHKFFDHYVKGTGSRPFLGATAITQKCPTTVRSEGPYRARTWAELHPGEVRHDSAPAQMIDSGAGDATVGRSFDPILGGLACTTAPATDQGEGVATYRLPAATGSGYTLLGAPTVTADLKVSGTYAYVAARLLDVDPATNTETLVARGVYRIDPEKPDGRQHFQLHANGWRFAAGHVPKLELLGSDAPFTRPSNGTFTIAVSNLQLRLPVHEVPEAPGTPAVVESPDSTPVGTPGCRNTRVVVMHVPGARRGKVRRIAVTVNGKRQRAKLVAGRGVRVVLRGRARGKTVVRVTLRMSTGKKLKATRTFRVPCTK